MKIDKNTFVYNLYSLSYILTQKFFGEDTWDEYYEKMNPVPTKINLCSMMRSMFIWSILYTLIIIGLIGGYGYVLFYLPFTYGGTIGYFNVYGVSFIIGVIGTLVVSGFKQFVIFLDDKFLSEQESTVAQEERHAAGNYTLMEIIGKYLQASKDKICPFVEIIQKGETK